MTRAPASYDRTQSGVLHRIFLVVAAVEVTTGILVATLLRGGIGLTIGLVLGASAAFSAIVAWMRIHDDGDALRVVLGPVELLKRRVPYASIRSVEPYQTTTMRNGIGIHMAPGGGWTWNVRKGPAVELLLEKGRLIVGTDAPEELVAFLRSKLRPR
jgi:hypothetical protein